MKWIYAHIQLDPTESHYDCLRANGALGWEAWHMEKDTSCGWRTIYFKRPDSSSETPETR